MNFLYPGSQSDSVATVFVGFEAVTVTSGKSTEVCLFYNSAWYCDSAACLAASSQSSLCIGSMKN
jgi:hypothetical protein